MQHVLSLVRAAAERYNMIDENDRIAVGVSGGKDSVALLAALAEMRRFYPKKYSVVAITLDYRFGNRDGDFSEIEKLCRELDVEYVVRKTNLYHVIFETRKEKNPCSLCAKMRRGLLHDAAKELGCNKIALGHHMDDAAETFIMNLFQGGTIGCFSPVSYLSRKDLTLIRPLIFVREREIESLVRREKLPVVKSKCPADKETAREQTKKLLSSLEESYPSLNEKIVGAMQKNHLDNW
jgi:tRNA(Ile)-lysidine synthetase-like protein